MYRIGMFSKINKVTVKTLRYYDEVGLLIPAYVDEENGYRYYTSNQLPIIHKIKALRQMGFTIDEITLILISSVFPCLKSLKDSTANPPRYLPSFISVLLE